MAAVNGHGGDLPPGPTGAGILWRRLLHLNADHHSQASNPDLAAAAPPLTPLDKNATSMRILLHDTQANFDKFSSHVEKLLTGVTETRTEIKAANSRFDRDRETMLGDIVDLVNRSQREIQKSIGTPAQTQNLDAFSKELFHEIKAIDRRLDSLYDLSQAQSQSLQAQVQATQLLLDKQGTIIAGVTPLLPLLQTLPLLLESITTTLKNISTSLSRPRLDSSPTHGKRRRTPSLSVAAPPSSSKRSRYDPPSDSNQEKETTTSPSSRSTAIPKTSPEAIPTSRIIESMRRSTTSRTPHSNSHITTSPDEQSMQLPTTPRRPLTDLPPARPPSRQPPVLPLAHSSPADFPRPQSSFRMTSPSVGRAASRAPSVLPTPRTVASHPPRILRVYGSIHSGPSRAPSRATSAVDQGPGGGAVGASMDLPPPQYTQSDAQMPTKPEPSLAIRLQPPSLASAHRRDFTPAPSSPGMLGTITAATATPGSVCGSRVLVKEKRSPVKGRRFIPLVDSEDEADEN